MLSAALYAQSTRTPAKSISQQQWVATKSKSLQPYAPHALSLVSEGGVVCCAGYYWANNIPHTLVTIEQVTSNTALLILLSRTHWNGLIAYLIIVIFFTLTQFLELKFYTQMRVYKRHICIDYTHCTLNARSKMVNFHVQSGKIYTGQKNLHWRRQPRQRQLSGMGSGCQWLPSNPHEQTPNPCQIHYLEITA